MHSLFDQHGGGASTVPLTVGYSERALGSQGDDLRAEVLRSLDEAERKAWASLARYKFWMFGYHAAQWVMLNRVAGSARGNPFRPLVHAARRHQEQQTASSSSNRHEDDREDELMDIDHGRRVCPARRRYPLYPNLLSE